MKPLDLTGKKFGRLTAIRPHGSSKSGGIIWECLCDCGNRCFVSRSNLGRSTKSCGCLSQENRVIANTKHGKRHSRIYYIWSSMIQRCYDPKCQSYKTHGEKGIKVCDEWREFTGFLKWAESNGYDDALSIDRIDNSFGYSPDNCRWATMKQQQNNRTNNRLVEYHGQKHTLSQWADIVGIKYKILNLRYYRGWPVERIFETPVRKWITK